MIDRIMEVSIKTWFRQRKGVLLFIAISISLGGIVLFGVTLAQDNRVISEEKCATDQLVICTPLSKISVKKGSPIVIRFKISNPKGGDIWVTRDFQRSYVFDILGPEGSLPTKTESALRANSGSGLLYYDS